MTDLMLDPLADVDLEEESHAHDNADPEVKARIAASYSRSADELIKFSQDYPVQVMHDLRENLLHHIAKVLEEAGLENTARLIGTELYEFDDYIQCVTVAEFTHERAEKMARNIGAEHLREAAAKVIRLMSEDGVLYLA